MAIADIIKYEGDNSTFVWKHPNEDFNTMTQLIVHQSQEAIFFMNGEALDLFGPGRHTLETQNIPFIKRILNIPTGGKTPFHCEIYFINKTQQMSIKWGTDSQVQYMEPTYKFPLQIGASGEMVLSVHDSRKLLIKVVGTEKALTQNELVSKFRAFLMSKIKPHLGVTMQKGGFSIFEIDSRIGELSSELHALLSGDFSEYGLKLDHFFVTNIAKPDGDSAYEKFKDLHNRQYSDVAEAQLQQKVDIIKQQTEAQRMVIEAAAMAQKRAQEGYSYGQERGFDVAEQIAQNEAVGEFNNMGIGLGMMAGVGGAVGSKVGGMVNDAMGSINGKPAPMQLDDMVVFKQKLDKLLMMKESGILSEEEFAIQKGKLLENI